MQLLPSLTRDPKVILREKPAGAHLPYAAQRDDYTIETRDGLLMQFIALRGMMFETADSEELNYRKVLRNAMLQSIGSSRFTSGCPNQRNFSANRKIQSHIQIAVFQVASRISWP